MAKALTTVLVVAVIALATSLAVRTPPSLLGRGRVGWVPSPGRPCSRPVRSLASLPCSPRTPPTPSGQVSGASPSRTESQHCTKIGTINGTYQKVGTSFMGDYDVVITLTTTCSDLEFVNVTWINYNMYNDDPDTNTLDSSTCSHDTVVLRTEWPDKNKGIFDMWATKLFSNGERKTVWLDWGGVVEY